MQPLPSASSLSSSTYLSVAAVSLLLRWQRLIFVLLLISVHTTTNCRACQVDFSGGVEIRFNDTAQVDLCTIVLRDIFIEQQQYACVVEKFAGNETEYGPIALFSTTMTETMMAVSERGVGESGAFTPDVYPFEGSILSFQYVVYPAFNETFCGGGGSNDDEDLFSGSPPPESSLCNATTILDVDVFGCFVQDATPSPSLPPATPRPSSPPFVMAMPVTTTITTFTPSSSSGGGVMATRSPTIMPADLPDVPTEAPAPKSVMAVVTKDPFKPPVSPSPTIQPNNNGLAAPPSFSLPPAASSGGVDAIQSTAAAAVSSAMVTAALALSLPSLVVLVAAASAGRLLLFAY